MLALAGMPDSGQMTLFDGRTGEQFERQGDRLATCTCLKLHHLVDDKMHAVRPARTRWLPSSRWAARRSSAASVSAKWSLGTGGLWRAYVLQEMLTVKSDDVNGRTKGTKTSSRASIKIDAGMPESFNVLVKEIRSLAISTWTWNATGFAHAPATKNGVRR